MTERKLNRRKVSGKVRVLCGVAALFLFLFGITVQAANRKTDWLANKDEWVKEKGYHLGAVVGTLNHPHGADDTKVIAVSIERDNNGDKLRPDKNYLKSHFKVKGATGKMSQKYKDQINSSKIFWETGPVTGTNSHMVTNLVAKLRVNGKEFVLAAPYTCQDGYAGYAYFRYYFSYCEYTKEFYYVTAEHEWLGCARGDVGINEYHPKPYTHNLYQYYIEPNRYTVTYKGNGADSGITKDQNAVYDTAFDIRANQYKKTGYTFTGWNTKSDGSGKTYQPGTSVKNLTDKDGGKITLYAQWKPNTLKIRYHANGGKAKSGYSLKNQIVQKSGRTFVTEAAYNDTSLNIYNVGTMLSRSGYTIDGDKAWRVGSTSGTVVSQETGSIPKVLKDMMREKSGQVVTLYANWEKDSGRLTVKPNGGVWNGKTTDQSFTLNYGAKKTIANPTRTGYTFTGWSVSGTGSRLSGQTFTMGTTNAVLKANWKINSYKLTVKPNGGSWNGKTADQSFTLNYKGTKTIATPTKTGYTFTGWSLSGTGSSLSGQSFTMGTGNAVLTANWKINSYKLTVRPNGGIWNGKTTDQSFSLNYKAAKTIANPTRTGYTFTGWSVSGTGSSLKGQTFTMGTGNAVLTANWKINSYKLTVRPNGGSWNGKTTDQSFTLNYKAAKTIANPTRAGYTFTGWSVSGTGSSLKGQTFTMGTGNAVLTANWKANTYTIRFNGNGATEGNMPDIQVRYDEALTLPENGFKRVTEQGESTFVGWNRNPDVFEAEFPEKGTVKNLTDKNGTVITLYAVWDDCPQITAKDRHFTLDFAKNGKITEEELLSTASAVDREDKELENRTKKQTEEQGLEGSLSLADYDVLKFAMLTENAEVEVTYQAVDSIGNRVTETITVFITNTEPLPQTEFEFTRFINKKYFNAEHENGGLHPESIWRKNPEYHQALEEALDNLENDTPVETYRFSHEDVERAKDFIDEHGFGKSKEEDALHRFYNEFMR